MKFSTTQFDLPEALARRVRNFASRIPDDELAPDGREPLPHITIKYGLHTGDAGDVVAVLEGIGPIKVRYGRTSIFAGNEGGVEFDVVKIDVEGDDLVALNRLLSERLPSTTTHAGYHPHVTIAYVRAGEGAKYADSDFLDGEEFEFNSVTFSNTDGERNSIYLTGAMEKSMDSLILLGESVKAAGEGKVQGYLVRFTTDKDADLDGDFFTKDTDFDIEVGTEATIYYAHAQDKTIKNRKLGKASMKVDDVGVWVEGQLNLRDKYEKKIYEMAEAGKLGWSSGTAAHLVTRKKEGKASRILSWPLGLDASLTPVPAEPRNAVIAFKSLMGLLLETKGATLASTLNAAIDDNVNDEMSRADIIKKMADEAGIKPGTVNQILNGDIERPPDDRLRAFARALGLSYQTLRSLVSDEEKSLSIKGIFEDVLEDRRMSVWDLWSALTYSLCEIAKAAGSSSITGVDVDVTAKVGEALAEFTLRLAPVVVEQIQDYLDTDNRDQFYVKNSTEILYQLTEAKQGGPLVRLSMSDHSDAVLAAVKELVERASRLQEIRVKEGRMISAANRKKLMDVHEQMAGMLEAMGALLDMSEPKPKEEPKSINPDALRSLNAKHLNLKTFMIGDSAA